ncbi:hypothetical protein [Faecalicatena contorta]|uniref:hypothetical protein n=1 Tax=Faecalicatena contorta TaxID=39482 RepID=UPI0032170795
MDVTIRIEKIDELIAAVKALTAAQGGGPGPQAGSAQAVPITRAAAVQQTGIPAQQNYQSAPVPVQAPQGQQFTQQAVQMPQQTTYSAEIAQRNQLPVAAMTGGGLPTTAVAQEYTQDQVAVAMSGLMDAGKRDTVTQILASFGVQALLQIPKDRYPELVLKLREAGANI